MNNITIIGGGVLGSQIAFQSAYSGKKVTIWLRSKESIDRTTPKLEHIKSCYIEAIEEMDKSINNWCNGISDVDNFNKEECLKKVEDAFVNIRIELDMKEALKDADLVIESMTEDINTKKDLFIKMSKLLEEKTILVTNSSTILPSKLRNYTGRSDKFLSLHFANTIWKNNIVEVMKHDKTSDDSFNKVIEFSKEIRMIPLPLLKEKSGYLLNSMLIPLLFSALDLYVNGVSDFKSIDEAWTKGTGSPKGPFRILDTVGLKTAYEIVNMYVKMPSFLAPYNFKEMAKLLKQYIDEGRLGESTGIGFYEYNIKTTIK